MMTDSRPLWHGPIEVISRKIQNGWDVNTQDELGASLLLRSVSAQRLDIVKLLLHRGADATLGMSPADAGRPLRVAVHLCRYDIVEVLISHGAQARHLVQDPDALIPAMRRGCTDLIRFLLFVGLDGNLTFNDGANLINQATKYGYADLTRHLLRLGANIHNVDMYGQNCIFHAVNNQDAALVRPLLQRGAEVNIHDASGMYLLGRAIVVGNPGIVSDLIEAGADMTRMDVNQLHCNAAQLALIAGNVDIMETVVRIGVDLTARNNHGENILDTCLKVLQNNVLQPMTCTSIFKFLVNKGATVETMRDYPYVPQGFFMYTTRALVDFMMSLGLRPSPPRHNIFYHTPLQEAYHNRDTGLVAHLVNVHGMDINMLDYLGNTLVNKAASDLSLWRLHELSELGADFNIANDGGIQPLQNCIFENNVTEAFKYVLDKSTTDTILHVLGYLSITGKHRYERYVIRYLSLNFNCLEREWLEQQLRMISLQCSIYYQECAIELETMNSTTIDSVPLSFILTLDEKSTLGRNKLILDFVDTFDMVDIFPNFWSDLVKKFEICAGYQSKIMVAESYLKLIIELKNISRLELYYILVRTVLNGDSAWLRFLSFRHIMELIQAIRNGEDLTVVQNIIAQGYSVNFYDVNGVSCLQAAVERGCPAIVQILLENGADPRAHIPFQEMYLAEILMRMIVKQEVSHGDLFSIFSMLADNGMAVELAEEYPCISVDVLRTISLQLLLLLLELGFTMEQMYEDESVLPITFLLLNEDQSIWQYLVMNRLLELSDRDTQGMTILMHKSTYPNQHLQLLLDFGADPNELNEDESPLTYAMYRKHEVTENFKVLLPVSAPSIVAEAFRSAVRSGYTKYQKYIIQEIALKCEREPHFSSILLSEQLRDWTYLKILKTRDVKELLHNTQLCNYVIAGFLPLPPCFCLENLTTKFELLKKLCITKLRAEKNLNRLMEVKVNASLSNVVEHIVSYLSVSDLTPVAEAWSTD
ncbi:hypothetical protein QAD02_001889 [Eretmocerus hayati]|uniref:Uncharacterized protein n=1 Tax=Eretmocerus hayati TaxID=131215 RepID=A0ACC2NHE5_9HYME|nr:hypothetical protein QAD02_001889 [Eretmocerus hayati]